MANNANKGYVTFYRGLGSEIPRLAQDMDEYGLYFATDTGTMYFRKNINEYAVIKSSDNSNVIFSRGNGTDSAFIIASDSRYTNTADGFLSFVVGGKNDGNGSMSFAYGNNNIANGVASFAGGMGNAVKGDYGVALGFGNTSKGNASMALGEGIETHNDNEISIGKYNVSTESDNPTLATMFSIGVGEEGSRKNAMEIRANGDIYIGTDTLPLMTRLFEIHGPFNYYNSTEKTAVLRDGDNTATGVLSFAIGKSTVAAGDLSFSEGNGTLASGSHSHAEGEGTTAYGTGSHAMGISSVASAKYANAEGESTTAGTGDSVGVASHAEGKSTETTGDYSHAEGIEAKASGRGSHAEGLGSKAMAEGAHASGNQSEAIGRASFAHGYHTQSNNETEAAFGKWNHSVTNATSFMNTMMSIGYGTSAASRSNAVEVKENGDVYYKDDLLDYIFTTLISKVSAITNINKCTAAVKYTNGKYGEIDDADIASRKNLEFGSVSEVFSLGDSLSDVSSILGSYVEHPNLTKCWADEWYMGSYTSFAHMFENCINLTRIGDVSRWNTSACTNLEYMFRGCSSLNMIGDISSWNTKNVTTTVSMFRDSGFAGNVDFSGWNSQSKMKHFDRMFENCSEMDYIGIPAIPAGSSTYRMFYGCSSLSHVTSCGVISAPSTYDRTLDLSDCPLTEESARLLFSKLDTAETGTLIVSDETIAKFGSLTLIEEVVQPKGWNVYSTLPAHDLIFSLDCSSGIESIDDLWWSFSSLDFDPEEAKNHIYTFFITNGDNSIAELANLKITDSDGEKICTTFVSIPDGLEDKIKEESGILSGDIIATIE